MGFLLLGCLFLIMRSTRPAKLCMRHLHSQSSNDLRITCLCTAAYCDDVDNMKNVESNMVVVYTSSKSGKRLEQSQIKLNKDTENDDSLIKVTVFPMEKKQIIIGFGGALTDAAVLNIDSLSDPVRNNLLSSYFGEDGLQYSILKLPIGSNEFSTRPYSYNEWEKDTKMKNFSLSDEDLSHRIKILQQIQKMMEKPPYLFAVASTAPAWMKSNKRLMGSGFLLREVDKIDIWKVYSLYLLRYFEEYAKHNIVFTAVSAQNEPNISVSPYFPWQAMHFSPKMLREFVTKYLHPTLKSQNATSHLQILPIDMSWESLLNYSQEFLTDENAFEYSNGIGVHGYNENLMSSEELRNLVADWANRYVIFTESANGWLTNDIKLGDWERGEKYIESIMRSMKNGVAGWVDYNVCLDMHGGPSWVGNNYDAAIIVDKHNQSFMKQPMFYAIGHFSKFVRPGAVYVVSDLSKKHKDVTDILFVSFENTNGVRTIVLYNKNTTRTYKLQIIDDKTGNKFNINLSPQSIITANWNFIKIQAEPPKPFANNETSNLVTTTAEPTTSGYIENSFSISYVFGFSILFEVLLCAYA